MATVELTWQDNSEDELGFSVERSTDGNNYTEIDVAAPDAEIYQDITAAVNTLYYYRVKAYNLFGYSDPCVPVQITTATPAILHNDTFTDTNGVQLINHTPDVGNGYSMFVGSAADAIINNNEAHIGNVLGGRAVITDIGIVYGFEITLQIKMDTATDFHGLFFACELGDNANIYAATVQSGNVRIEREGHGGTSVLASESHGPFSTGVFYDVTLSVTGSNIAFTYDGVTANYAWTPPASNFTYVGFYTNSPNSFIIFDGANIASI